jgi:hypothetical protein
MFRAMMAGEASRQRVINEITQSAIESPRMRATACSPARQRWVSKAMDDQACEAGDRDDVRRICRPFHGLVSVFAIHPQR